MIGMIILLIILLVLIWKYFDHRIEDLGGIRGFNMYFQIVYSHANP